jgi:hypothetical protein
MSYSLRSRRYCLGLIFILFSLSAHAQEFSKEGKFVPKDGHTVLYETGFTPGYDPAKVDTAALRKIKAQLIPKMKATLAYMDGDKEAVKALYETLFSVGFYEEYHQELTDMINYLTTGIQNGPMNHLPPFSDLQKFMDQEQFGTPQKAPGSPNYLVYNLTKNELLTKYLLDRYNTMIKNDAVAGRKMDGGYIRDWKDMEQMFTDLKSLQAEIKKVKQNIYKITDADVAVFSQRNKKIDLKSNPLVNQIGGSDLLKGWLWYSGGIPGMNPLGVTTTGRRYSLSEINTFYTAEQQKNQEELNGSGLLEAFALTRGYYNSLTILIKNDNDSKYALTEYDASQADPANANYFKLTSGKLTTLKDKLNLKLSVYNVPADQKITLIPGQSELVYESKAVTAAKGIFGSFLMFQNFMTGNFVNLAKAELIANPKGATLVPPKFAAAGESHPMADTSFVGHGQGAASPKIHSIKIGKRIVPLTTTDQDEDKKRLLSAWYESNGKDTKDPEFVLQMDAFVQVYHYDNFLNYNVSLRDFQREVILLAWTFNDFLETIKKRIEELNKTLTEINDKTKAAEIYVRLTNRSLPPETIAEKFGKTPILKTFTYTFKMPAAPNNLTYTIVETGPTKDAEPKEVGSGSYQVIETQKFDFSVGLAYTFPTYYVTSDGTPPTSNVGDHFQFTGGANIYPFGRLNKLGKGVGPPEERFSVYLGLSLTHPLDHYFTGFSYDITPGIRPTLGMHWFKDLRYQVLNGSVVDKASGIVPAGFFISINFEPAVFIKNVTSK